MKPRPRNETAQKLYQELDYRIKILDLAVACALESAGLETPSATLEELYSCQVDA